MRWWYYTTFLLIWRCPLKAGMTSLADLFIAFLSPIRLGDVHEGGGERVVGDEGGGKADDGKSPDVVQCAHGAKDEYEEHRAENECRHAHRLSDFAVREQ